MNILNPKLVQSNESKLLYYLVRSIDFKFNWAFASRFIYFPHRTYKCLSKYLESQLDVTGDPENTSGPSRLVKRNKIKKPHTHLVLIICVVLCHINIKHNTWIWNCQLLQVSEIYFPYDSHHFRRIRSKDKGHNCKAYMWIGKDQFLLCFKGKVLREWSR